MTAPIKQPCCLRREQYDAIKELRQMNDLVFLKPDKRSGVLVMNRQTYTTKMKYYLSDEQRFRRDITPENNFLTEKQISSKLQLLLLYVQYRKLKPMGTKTPTMKGSPKTHKEGIPLRPILCMNNSPYHKLGPLVSGRTKTYQKPFINALCQRLIWIGGYTRTYLDEFQTDVFLLMYKHFSLMYFGERQMIFMWFHFGS